MTVPSQAIDWESRYRDGSARWERAEVNPAWSNWVKDGTLAPCRILVPGAGRSAEPLSLAQAGFQVTIVDVAPSAVAFQQAQLAPVGGQAVLADLFGWQPDHAFDAIYDQTCLCALPPDLWDGYAARLAGWLRPGGVLAILFMQTGREGGPPFHCDLDRMRMLFPETAWAWPADLPPQVNHPMGPSEQPAALRRR